jgi:hypothetical protein
MTPIGDVPFVVIAFLVLSTITLIVAIFLPHFRRLRMQQRIRKLPPPPIKQEVEPDLTLPRRRGPTGGA